MAQELEMNVPSLHKLASDYVASSFLRSLNKAAKDQGAILDFNNYEIPEDKIEVFKTFIESNSAKVIILYHRTLRKYLTKPNGVKEFYKNVFGLSSSKCSWLWYFFENTESFYQSFTFKKETHKMDLLKIEYILDSDGTIEPCKRLHFHNLTLWHPSRDSVEIEEKFEDLKRRFSNLCDKFPNVTEFRIDDVNWMLKSAIYDSLVKFNKLETLVLPEINGSDKTNFKAFSRQAPKNIQSLCLKFSPCSRFSPILEWNLDKSVIEGIEDLLPSPSPPFQTIDECLRSLNRFKNLVSLKLNMSYDLKISDLKIPQNMIRGSLRHRHSRRRKRIPTDDEIIRQLAEESESRIRLVDMDNLKHHEDKIYWVNSISITFGHMYVLRLIDKYFMNVKRLNFTKLFNEPFLKDGVPIAANLRSVEYLSIQESEVPFDLLKVKISGIFTLFPNLKELSITCLSLQNDEKFEDIPEAGFLEKLVVTQGIVTPANLITKMSNLKHLILIGAEDNAELDQHLPAKCAVTLKPFSH